MKEMECPNCGGANPEILSEGEFRCTYCETLYYDHALVKQKKASEKKVAYAKAQEAKHNVQVEQFRTASSMSKRVLFVVIIGLVVIFGYVGYMAKRSMDQTTKAQEEMLKSMQPAK